MLTVLCNVSSLLPLFFIGWLDGVGDVSEEDMEAEEMDLPNDGGENSPSGPSAVNGNINHMMLNSGLPHEHSNEHGRIEER